MVFFGGGKWRRQFEELSVELERTRELLRGSEDENKRLKKEGEDREASAKSAREGRKKADKKVEKLTQSRQAAEQKLSAQQSRLEKLEGELEEYRSGLVKARDEAEKAHARLARLEKSLGQEMATVSVESAADAVKDEAKPTPAELTPRKVDRRIERLEEQLSDERNARADLKDRIARAEKTARDAERRRIADTNKAEAVVRDLQHSLRSERRAYKILQLQYEAQLVQVRDLRQSIQPAEIAPPTIDDADVDAEAPTIDAGSPELDPLAAHESADSEAKERSMVDTQSSETEPALIEAANDDDIASEPVETAEASDKT